MKKGFDVNRQILFFFYDIACSAARRARAIAKRKADAPIARAFLTAYYKTFL